ncbi:hypothetical protein BSF38_01640 [Paludisphaera borealis]|uniref:Uncharacterized protein n=1 Tax=Paludisphaera borealis TaxID=1387353 RepID=A0A1U7CMJ7_9BACT|nr:hypothetical protein BSF38_01640 [Paludisphaera borealis]
MRRLEDSKVEDDREEDIRRFRKTRNGVIPIPRGSLGGLGDAGKGDHRAESQTSSRVVPSPLFHPRNPFLPPDRFNRTSSRPGSGRARGLVDQARRSIVCSRWRTLRVVRLFRNTAVGWSWNVNRRSTPSASIIARTKLIAIGERAGGSLEKPRERSQSTGAGSMAGPWGAERGKVMEGAGMNRNWLVFARSKPISEPSISLVYSRA